VTRIELVIDEVVWHGGEPGDRRRFGAELERALVHELGDPRLHRSLATGDRRVSCIDAGPVPRVAGDTVARAVIRGVAGASRSGS
jgi:hypothetical protein